MSLFVKWKELLVTQDSTRFVTVCTLLQNAGIEYKEKTQNIGHGNRRHGQIGSIGESSAYANLFQVFVKAADIERSEAIISKR